MQHASALTAPNLAGVDVVIDFTAPEAALENMRAVLALGGRIVVGTTGWYAQLAEMKALAMKRGGGLLYGTNFSIGVQKLFRLTAELAQLEGYKFSIDETHHTTKLDAPSGTALTLKEIILAVRPGIDVPIDSHRVGDAKGEHIVRAVSDHDMLELRHDAQEPARLCAGRGARRGVAGGQIGRVGVPRDLRAAVRRAQSGGCERNVPASSLRDSGLYSLQLLSPR